MSGTRRMLMAAAGSTEDEWEPSAILWDTDTALAAGTGDRAWNHTADSDEVVGALVFVVETARDIEDVIGVTYGGVAMQRVGWQGVQTGETGGVGAYFLANGSMPQGTQSIAIDMNASGVTYRASACTIKSATPGLVLDYVFRTSAGTAANPVTGNITGVPTSQERFTAFDSFNGNNSFSGVSMTAGWTNFSGVDFGSQIANGGHKDTLSTTDDIGTYTAGSEEWAMVAVSVYDVDPLDMPDNRIILPSDLMTPVAWFNDAGLTGNDGDAVASWAGTAVGGVGPTFAQVTGGLEPTLKTAGNGINSKEVARFAASGTDWLSTADATTYSPTTNHLVIAAVIRPTVVNVTQTILGKNLAAGTAYEWWLHLVNDVPRLQLYQTAGSSHGVVSETDVVSAGTAYIVIARIDYLTKASIWLNGGAGVSTTSFTNTMTNGAGLLYAGQRGDAQSYGDLDIAEISIHRGGNGMNVSDLNGLLRYYEDRFAISGVTDLTIS